MSKDLNTILTDPRSIKRMAELTKRLSKDGSISLSFDSPTEHIEIGPDGTVTRIPRKHDRGEGR